MDPRNHSAGRRRGGLLGWLGLGPRVGKPQTDPSARTADLAAIGAFLDRHGLETCSESLSIAHAYVSGSDPQLVRQIDKRLALHEPITIEWLDELRSEASDGHELKTLAQLMTRLEASIDEFARTSSDAHKATSEYHSALEEHVEELEQVNLAGEVISELASIAKVMLKRTRGIEKQMLRSEANTRLLKRRLDEARRNAEEDLLTGLPNRRAFEARFEQEYREAREAADQLCVAFCDIDDFKTINDAHGHDAGDRVLRQVAEALARISDDRCHVSRHGGEEFVVLFRSLGLTEAETRLDQLRQQLAQRRFVNRATDQPFGQITFSAGLADVFAFADRRAALKAADTALLRAKLLGKNRIERAS